MRFKAAFLRDSHIVWFAIFRFFFFFFLSGSPLSSIEHKRWWRDEIEELKTHYDSWHGGIPTSQSWDNSNKQHNVFMASLIDGSISHECVFLMFYSTFRSCCKSFTVHYLFEKNVSKAKTSWSFRNGKQRGYKRTIFGCMWRLNIFYIGYNYSKAQKICQKYYRLTFKNWILEFYINIKTT